MKLAFSAALLAVVFAQEGEEDAFEVSSVIVREATGNNCIMGEGATWLGHCFGMYSNLCDEFTMPPGEKCNVTVFNNAQIDTLSDQIYIRFWSQLLTKVPRAEYDKIQAEMARDQTIHEAKKAAKDRAEKECNPDEEECSEPANLEEDLADVEALHGSNWRKNLRLKQGDADEEEKSESEVEVVAPPHVGPVPAREGVDPEDDGGRPPAGFEPLAPLTDGQVACPVGEPQEGDVLVVDCVDDYGEICLDKTDEGGIPISRQYQVGTILATVPGICGYRIEIGNDHPTTSFKFTVYRDAAVALYTATGALVAGIAAVSF